jgi:hypothetical protein
LFSIRETTGTPFAQSPGMNATTINSTDPMVHAQHIQNMLDELITHSRQDIEQVKEPRFQALLETTAEVLNGLKTAFRDYSEGKEKVWKH